MCGSNCIEVKTGETVMVRVTVTDQNGPVNLSTATISATMSNGTVNVPFNIFPDNLPQGKFFISANAPSTPGTYQADIKIVVSGSTFYSRTFIVHVVKAVTP